MNFKFISLILGAILALEAAMMVVCFACSCVSDPDPQRYMTLWGVSIFGTALVGFLLLWVGRGGLKGKVFRREGFAVVGLSWLITGFFGAIPFVFSPLRVPMYDALFECYSGFTTTGATIFRDLNLLSPSLLLWRSLMQWMGGMGIIVLFVALLGFLGIGGKVLFQSETSSIAPTDLRPKIASLSMAYLQIYVGITIVGIIGLIFGGMSLFDATCHTMCALSTGGFSPYNESIAHFPQWHIQLWIVLIMFLGGVAFPLHYQVFFLKKWNAIRQNGEVSVYIAIILIATVFITMNLLEHIDYSLASLPQAFVDSLFHTVSILTTTGFVTKDYNTWPEASKLILLGLMLVGGCAGSTGGGIKVGRFIIFAKGAYRELKNLFRPHRIIRLRMNQRAVDEGVVSGVVFYFALYFILLIIGVLGLTLLQPKLPLPSVLSAVLACFNNIGPGLEAVGPAANYAFLDPFSKMWLSVFMILGRVEIFGLLLLFMPSFWKKF